MISQLSPLDPSPLHERVYQQLRHSLMAGLFHPGEAVTLRGIATALGTSIMPVREAVRRLVSENALVMPSARSIRVPSMSRDKFDELCRMRMLLEGEAAAIAAGEINAVEIDKLIDADHQIARALDNRDASAMLAANQLFHYIIYRAARQDIMLSFIEMLWIQAGPYLNLIMQSGEGEFFDVDFSRHADLIDALKRRNARHARDAIRTDIMEASAIYRTYIDSSSGR